MIDLPTLLLFSFAVSLLLLSPGPNMAFVLAHGIRYGWRGGVAVALGIGLADAVLTVLTAAGVTGAVAAWPPALPALRLAGAVYLLWLAWQALQPCVASTAAVAPRRTLAAVAGRATLNSLLNPKALLFFLVFLPQFVDPARGPVLPQLALLGAVLTLLAVIFHAALGVLASAAAGWAAPGAARWRAVLLAAVLAGLAARLMLMPLPH